MIAIIRSKRTRTRQRTFFKLYAGLYADIRIAGLEKGVKGGGINFRRAQRDRYRICDKTRHFWIRESLLPKDLPMV